MKIDLNAVVTVLTKLVSYIKGITIVLGSHTVNLWMFLVCCGTLDALYFIIGRHKAKDNE